MPWLGKSDVEARIETIKSAMDDAASDVATRGALLVQTNQRQSATHRPGPFVRHHPLAIAYIVNRCNRRSFFQPR